MSHIVCIYMWQYITTAVLFLFVNNAVPDVENLMLKKWMIWIVKAGLDSIHQKWWTEAVIEREHLIECLKWCIRIKQMAKEVA